MWTGKNYLWNGSISLNTGWYPFNLNFYWNANIVSGTIGNPFLTAYHQSPNTTKTNVISASIINTKSGFLTPIVLPNLINVKERVDRN